MLSASKNTNPDTLVVAGSGGKVVVVEPTVDPVVSGGAVVEVVVVVIAGTGTVVGVVTSDAGRNTPSRMVSNTCSWISDRTR